MITQNSISAWFLAARPKTLAAAGVPVIVAGALAYATSPTFRAGAFALCLLFAWLMQVASNFINDLFDYLRGDDGEDRLGPERACAQGWITPRAMRIGIAVVLAMACSVGLDILWQVAEAFWQQSTQDFSLLALITSADSWLLLALGAACVLFAFLYTTHLSRIALGDVLVLVFFGFVPVMGTYYAMTGQVTPAAILLGLACGLVTDTLLVVNNFRDRDTDARAGKRTLVVIIGARNGELLYALLGITAACTAAHALIGLGAEWQALVPLIYLPVHLVTYRRMCIIRQGRALNAILGRTASNILLFGVLTAVALLLMAKC